MAQDALIHSVRVLQNARREGVLRQGSHYQLDMTKIRRRAMNELWERDSLGNI